MTYPRDQRGAYATGVHPLSAPAGSRRPGPRAGSAWLASRPIHPPNQFLYLKIRTQGWSDDRAQAASR